MFHYVIVVLTKVFKQWNTTNGKHDINAIEYVNQNSKQIKTCKTLFRKADPYDIWFHYLPWLALGAKVAVARGELADDAEHFGVPIPINLPPLFYRVFEVEHS